jgi:CARDB
MRIPKTLIAFLLFIFAIVACTPQPLTPTNPGASEFPTTSPLAFPTNTSGSSSQPDLTITHMVLEMEGRQGNCVNAYSPYGIGVQIENIGSANAGTFVVDLNGSRQQVDDGLMAGQSVVLFFSGTTSSGNYEATVDAANQVMESREDNNSLSYIAPTPTPPPLCTPTPTIAP